MDEALHQASNLSGYTQSLRSERNCIIAIGLEAVEELESHCECFGESNLRLFLSFSFIFSAFCDIFFIEHFSPHFFPFLKMFREFTTLICRARRLINFKAAEFEKFRKKNRTQ